MALYKNDRCPVCRHPMSSHRAVRNRNPFCHECLEVCKGPPITWVESKRPSNADKEPEH